jgi:hypothetical protein
MGKQQSRDTLTRRPVGAQPALSVAPYSAMPPALPPEDCHNHIPSIGRVHETFRPLPATLLN